MVILISLVVGSVIGALAQYGVAMTGNAKCGIEEHQHELACYEKTLVCTQTESEGHQHTDECYQTVTSLVCGLEESEEHTHSDACYVTEQQLICSEEEGTGHQHTDACYEEELACGKELHTHGEECYIDTDADVEDAAVWNKQYEKLEWKDTWSENLVLAAREQIGYKESSDNYTIAEDGSHKGYTRYGQFAVDTGVEAADVYADWDTAFVNFCLFYAGLSTTDIFPDKLDTVEWYEEFRKINENIDEYLSCLVAPEGYTPKAGDIVIFQKGIEEEEREYQMGIVSSYDKEKDELKVIEGNSGNEVKENDYYIEAKDAQDDEMAPVFCYLDMSGLEKAYKGTDEEPEDPVEPGEPVEPEDPEEPKDDVTEEEDPAEDPKEENPDGETDGEEDPEEEDPEEETIELTTKVDGTTITLSGPASSFEEGKKYEIQAEKVEDEETIATIEEAIDKEVEKQEKKVENYQAFDIKLLLDGEEVQPLGPVEVKFSGKEVKKSVENEETEVSVLHVDEETGEATDMEATATEEKEVVIETEHFSVYVYLEVNKDVFKNGGADIDIQHWARSITTIRKPKDGEIEEEEAFDTDNLKVKTEDIATQLYSTDKKYHIPFEAYLDVRKLSKVCNTTGEIEDKVDENAKVEEDKKPRYEIAEVWVSNNTEGADYSDTKENWEEGTFTRFSKEQLDKVQEMEEREEIKDLKDGSVIRFWYTPIEETKSEPVMFYDYNISNNGKDSGNEEGINAKSNFANDGRPKLGIGQQSSGNLSTWAGGYYEKYWNEVVGAYKNKFIYTGDKYDGKNLNAGNEHTLLSGIADSTLNSNGNITFSHVDTPLCLFEDNPVKGSTAYSNYKLQFEQIGDTYTLKNVLGSDGKKTMEHDLTTFFTQKKSAGGMLYSNKFWPLDSVSEEKDSFREKASDFNETHNWHFGMTYEVEFEIGDYTGPMEYYFRGDDDFWLYVDGHLAVDLGGIHSAIGHTFDLKAFINKKVAEGVMTKEGKHTLKVFYMERGGFGSCCYMQFTLPRAKLVNLKKPETTQFTVKKEWRDANNGFRPEQIEVTLLKEKGDKPVEEVDTVILPQIGENGKEIWEYTWSRLPLKDGKTGENISYTVKEELIDPRNKENPMLGYEVNKDIQGTTATLINTMEKKKVKVIKKWEGDEQELVNRPDSVQFKLYANGEIYKDHDGKEKLPIILEKNQDGIWEGEFDNLPEYYYDDSIETMAENGGKGKWKPIKYSVKEYPTKLTESVVDGKNGAVYEVTYTEIPLDEVSKQNGYIAIFEATNTLITKNVSIKKISKSTGTPPLAGAVFNLYQKEDFDTNGIEDAKVLRSLRTEDDGLVDIQGLRFGAYYLVEIEAPKNYAMLENPIEIIASENGVSVNFNIDGWESNFEHVKLENGKYIITIPNDIMYELPSTGGPGTYGYMFSGVLLLAVTALITYRNKRKEVLRS